MRRRIPQQVVIHLIALLALFVGLIPPTTPSSVSAAPAQVRANRIVPTPTLPSPQLAVAQAVSTPTAAAEQQSADEGYTVYIPLIVVPAAQPLTDPLPTPSPQDVVASPTASPTAAAGAPVASPSPTAAAGAPVASPSPTTAAGAPVASPSPTTAAGAPVASPSPTTAADDPTAATGDPSASPTAQSAPPGEAGETTDQLLVTAEQGGVLRSADGTLELTVPDGAVAGPTTLRYRRLVGMAALPGFLRVGEAFELVATDAQGQAVRHFAQPLTLRVSYPAPQEGEYEQLGLYFSDAEHPTWTPLATTVDSQAHVVTAQVDHFTGFMTMAAAPECSIAVAPTLLATYQAAEGTGRILGCPVDEAYTWGGLLSQDFQHGARIVGNFYLGPNYKNAYEAAGGPQGWLGLPLQSSFVEDPAPDTYYDHARDFRGSPIQLFQHGFIGFDEYADRWSAAYHFPLVCQVSASVTERIVNPPQDADPDEVATRFSTLRVRAGGIAAPAAPAGVRSFAAATLDFSVAGSSQRQAMERDGDSFVFAYEVEQPVSAERPEFTFVVEATRSDDGFMGFAPFDLRTTHQPFQVNLTTSVNTACPDGSSWGGGYSPPRDTTPPVIAEPLIITNGFGSLALLTTITDNTAVAHATLFVNDQPFPLTRLAGDRYGITLPRLAAGRYRLYITASDPAGNVGRWPARGELEFRIVYSGVFGYVPWVGYSEDPVSTLIGNFVYEYSDLKLQEAGPDLEIARFYNAQNQLVGRFGMGWSTLLDMQLTVFDNELMPGALLRYADGRTALFPAEGDAFGLAPYSFDALTREGSGFLLTTTDQTRYRFAADGRLTQVEDRSGNALVVSYSGDHPSQITTASGRVVNFTSDGEGRVTRLDAPDGVSITYSYDGEGRLLEVQDAQGGTVSYAYDPEHGMTKLTTPDGIDFVQEQRYDEQGRVLYQRVGENFINEFSYDDDQQSTTVVDTYGNAITHRYDEDGRLIEQIDALGQSERFSYNDDNQLTSHTDRNGHTTTYEYADGNRVRKVDALGHAWTWSYDAQRNVTSETDPLGRTTRYEYDAEGRRTATIDALGNRVTMRYNAQGQLVEIVGPRGDVTRYTYDADGNLSEQSDALGHTTTYEYDALGRKIRETDELGGVKQWAYDANGNLLREVDQLGYTRTYSYNADNGRTSVTDALGHTTNYTYNALGHLVTTTTPDGGVRSIVYNDLGHKIAEIDPLGQQRTWELDALYRIVAATDPTGAVTRYSYDANGNQVAITDARGFTTQIEYDALNREVRRIDALGGVTENSYDAVGNRVQAIAPNGATTTYVYDELNRIVQVVDALGHVSTTSYDAAGQRSSETNALGYTTRWEYDLLGRVVATTDALGFVTRTAYDALGRVVATTDARGAITRSSYDAAGRLIERVDALGNRSAMAYDALGNTIVVTDALGFATTTTYDAMRRPLTVTNALGGVTSTSYDLAGRRVVVTDANGNSTHTAYDALGRTLLVTDALGFVVASRYDANGNLIETTDQLGATTNAEFDALNRVVRQINALGFATEFTYDVMGNLLATTDANGAVTSSSYDLLGRLLTTTNALGYTTQYSYDALGRRITTTDANGGVISKEYDALGRVIRETDAEGFTRSSSYDEAGNLLATTDANGNTTTMRYDLLGRMIEERDAIGLVQGVSYDAVGNRIALIDGNNHTTLVAYDALGRQVSVTDAEGHTTTYAYDAVGNLVAITDANRHTTTHGYDERNQRTTTTDARGHTVRLSYDAVGRPLMSIDALGVITRNEYDALGQLVAVILNYNPSSLPNNQTNVTTRYHYDAVGNRISITDPKGAVVNFTPDALGQLVSESDPLGQITFYTFDAVGNQIERHEANGNLVQTSFDLNRRPVRVVYSDGSSVERYYDGNSNLIQLRDSSGVTDFSYDARNRKTSETNGYGVVAFRYDGANNEVALTYPDGRTLLKSYYRNNWLHEVTTPAGSVASYHYNGIGQVVRLVGGDEGTLTTQSYDAANNLLSVEKRKVGPNGRLLIGISYSYDAANQRTAATFDYRDGQPRTVSETYTQDRLYRLTEMRDSVGVVVNYSYDAAGNRTSWTGNDDPRTNKPFDAFALRYHYDAADQLVRMEDTIARTSVSYRYDANGNRIERHATREAMRYSYDSENRLAIAQAYQITGGERWNPGEITTMLYDGIGRRIAKSVDNQVGGGGSKTRTYAYAGLDPISYRETWNGQHTNLYRTQSGHILAQTRYTGSERGQQLWLTQDGLGSTVALAHDNGQTAKNYRYDPYGVSDEREFDSTTHIDFLFTGQEHDPSTGLHHFHARDYDPVTATWLTRDPYRGTPNDPQSLHRYGYVKGNPVNLWDVYGYMASGGSYGYGEKQVRVRVGMTDTPVPSSLYRHLFITLEGPSDPEKLYRGGPGANSKSSCFPSAQICIYSGDRSVSPFDQPHDTLGYTIVYAGNSGYSRINTCLSGVMSRIQAAKITYTHEANSNSVVYTGLLYCNLPQDHPAPNGTLPGWGTDLLNNYRNPVERGKDWANDQWQNTQDWANDQWQDSKDWANDQWQDTKDKANDQWQNTQDWANDQWQDSKRRFNDLFN